MPPHLRKSVNQAYLENGTYEQIVPHLEKKLELNDSEAPEEMPINTVTQQAPQQDSEKPKPTSHHCKKSGHYQNQCRQLKQEKDQTRNNTKNANNNKGSAQANSNPNNNVSNNTEANNTNNKKNRRSRPVFPPVRPVVEQSTPQRNVTLEQTDQTDRLLGIDDRKDRTKSSREMLKATRIGMSKL